MGKPICNASESTPAQTSTPQRFDFRQHRSLRNSLIQQSSCLGQSQLVNTLDALWLCEILGSPREVLIDTCILKHDGKYDCDSRLNDLWSINPWIEDNNVINVCSIEMTLSNICRSVFPTSCAYAFEGFERVGTYRNWREQYYGFLRTRHRFRIYQCDEEMEREFRLCDEYSDDLVVYRINWGT